MTHRLATVHFVQRDRRQTDASMLHQRDRLKSSHVFRHSVA